MHRRAKKISRLGHQYDYMKSLRSLNGPIPLTSDVVVAIFYPKAKLG